MRSLLLLAMLLWCVAHVQTQNNTNTMRLCGRALLRAVVFTCGGSRWRRLTGEEKALPYGIRDPNLIKTTNVPAMDRHWRDQNQALISVCCTLGCRKSDLSMLC